VLESVEFSIKFLVVIVFFTVYLIIYWCYVLLFVLPSYRSNILKKYTKLFHVVCTYFVFFTDQNVIRLIFFFIGI
jgi:hypothetical protein